MPELEIGELIFLTIATVPIILSFWIIRARKDILKYMPVYYCIYITFFSTNIEALILPDVFNFIEHFSLMLAGIFMFSAVVYDFYTRISKQKVNQLNQGMVTK